MRSAWKIRPGLLAIAVIGVGLAAVTLSACGDGSEAKAHDKFVDACINQGELPSRCLCADPFIKEKLAPKEVTYLIDKFTDKQGYYAFKKYPLFDHLIMNHVRDGIFHKLAEADGKDSKSADDISTVYTQSYKSCGDGRA